MTLLSKVNIKMAEKRRFLFLPSFVAIDCCRSTRDIVTNKDAYNNMLVK